MIIHDQKHRREEGCICIPGARDLGGQGSKRLHGRKKRLRAPVLNGNHKAEAMS